MRGEVILAPVVSYGTSVLAAIVGTVSAGGQPGARVEVAVSAPASGGSCAATGAGSRGSRAAEVLMPGARRGALVGLFVCVAAVLILPGWLQVAPVSRPWLAERDPPRVAWRTVSRHLPPERPRTRESATTMAPAPPRFPRSGQL